MTNISKVDLNLLKSLQALLAERHVGRAAQRMNVTQSAMSQTLARLRYTFNDPLFVRTARGLTPTTKALELNDPLNFILAEIGTLLTPGEFEPASLQRRFCIQTHEFIAAGYLAKALAQVISQAPGIVIDIRSMTDDCFARLDDGETDLIISAGLKASPRTKQQRYLDETLSCLLADDHPALDDWRPETLFRYPHIKSPLLDEQHDPVTAYGKKQDLPPRQIAMYVAGLSLQPAMIEHTRMIAFLPESLAVAGTKHHQLSCRPAPFKLPRLSIKGLWHERNQQDPAHSWLRQQIKQALADQH